ncbi:MAG: DUF4369 domain-containing protein [Prevotella sp.]|nr:DUF4369 domain-containing protein [Prevotella sp.]
MKNNFTTLSIADVCLAIIAMVTITSCTKYDIIGSSDLQGVDGRMIYLRTLTGETPQGIDSCDVVHGKFRFSGALDSVKVVMLCMDNNAMMPIVLEDGKIRVEINAQKISCGGTPLNDSLTSFTNSYRQLALQMADLEHTQNQAYMNGEDMDEVNKRLALAERELLIKEDKLVSRFIADNFDNCLGPYVFFMATQAYEYPILTPWIEALMTKATDAFKNNPIIKEYMEAAQHNQDVMTGVADVQQPAMPDVPTHVPTPNDMAKPEK